MDEWPLTGKYGHVHGWVDNTHGCMVINREVWTHIEIDTLIDGLTGIEMGALLILSKLCQMFN